MIEYNLTTRLLVSCVIAVTLVTVLFAGLAAVVRPSTAVFESDWNDAAYDLSKVGFVDLVKLPDSRRVSRLKLPERPSKPAEMPQHRSYMGHPVSGKWVPKLSTVADIKIDSLVKVDRLAAHPNFSEKEEGEYLPLIRVTPVYPGYGGPACYVKLAYRFSDGGEIIDIEVVSSNHPDCEKEAIETLKSFPPIDTGSGPGDPPDVRRVIFYSFDR